MAKLQQRADGRYRAKYKDKYFYATTQREALKMRDEYKYKCEHGIDDVRQITLGEYAQEWLPSAKASVSVKCYNDYAKQLDKLIAVCGYKNVNAVTPADIKKTWKQFVGMSASTIHRANMIYKSMFASAVENGYCKTNPVKSESAKPHKGTKGSHRAITEEERNLILTTPHRVQTSAMIMLYAGLRRGQVLALTDSQVSNGEINVNKSVTYNGNQPIIKSPKTANSVRKVPIVSVLQPYMHFSGYALKSAEGGICTQIAFKRAWDSYMHTLSEKAGHKIYIQPHDLRHSFCTWCRDAGVQMHVLIKWLGHADEKMVLQIYDHVSEDRVAKSVDLLNQSKNGGQTGVKKIK